MTGANGAGTAKAVSAGGKARSKSSRKQRIRFERGRGSRAADAVHPLNRAYVAHERPSTPLGTEGAGPDQALCGRRQVEDRVKMKYGRPTASPHRFAKPGEPVMCNACQRERVRLDRGKGRGK